MGSTPAAVRRFGPAITDAILTDHGVASPLGVWLLYAQVAPAASGRAREALEDALTVSAAQARQGADDLLGAVHPAVAAALAVWLRPAYLTPDADAWTSTLSPAVERGPVPTQADADRWAGERTRGLIERFPTAITPSTAIVLASALATKLSWRVPFERAETRDLGGPFASTGATALRTPEQGHRVLLVRTDAAGTVAVHVAASADGFSVASVIGDAALPATRIQRAALEAWDVLAGSDSGRIVPLPAQATGPAWTVSERSGFGAREQGVAVLPAWTAESTHDLSRAPGMPAAFATLAGLLRPGFSPASFDAAQAAVARYTREGFEAAAVTSISVRAAGIPRKATVRVLDVRFGHPYAVVAGVLPGRSRGTASRWDGVPVFSAWISRP